MSKWGKNFFNHQFFPEWNELKLSLESESINDQIILENIEALARLKKIIGYIDGMVLSLDPELTPLKILQPCYQEAFKCRNAIQQYSGHKTPDLLDLANECADTLLSYIRPYSIVPQGVQRGLRKAFKVYAETMSAYVSSFETKSNELLKEITQIRVESEEQSGRIKQVGTSVEEFEADLFGEEPQDDGMKGRINEFMRNINEKNDAINNIYVQVVTGDEDTLPVRKTIVQAKDSLSDTLKEIKLVLSEARQKTDELNEFHEEIYGVLDEDNNRNGGLLIDFRSRISDLGAFEAKQADRYKALNEQIESLLPGATSAGLATAYRMMKENFDRPIQHMTHLFYISIMILCCISFYFIFGKNELLEVHSDWNAVLRGLIYKTPIYIPILWLAFYASKRRSENQRLQQEYAHKEALAKSYDSYKKQLEQLGDENREMQCALIAQVMDAIAYNPAATLDGKHGDKMPAVKIISEAISPIFDRKKEQKT